jgi:hypothetical protein
MFTNEKLTKLANEEFTNTYTGRWEVKKIEDGEYVYNFTRMNETLVDITINKKTGGTARASYDKRVKGTVEELININTFYINLGE